MRANFKICCLILPVYRCSLVCNCKAVREGKVYSLCFFFVFSQFSRSVVSDSATPRIAAHQASLSITNSQSLFKLMSIESVMPFSHLILCRSLLLLPPIPPSIGSFPMSQLFASGGKSIGVSASASVLPMNAQD